MLLRKEGKIIEIIDRYNFNVLVEPDLIMHATISEHMIAYQGKEFKKGDIVCIDFHSRDTSRGRIHRNTFFNEAS